LKLPNAENVRIDDGRVRGHLLSTTHAVGRFKARVFSVIGFDETKADAFVAELRRLAAVGEVAEVEDFPFGRKYTVPGELRGPAGSLPVQTVWIEEPGQPSARLVTVRPR